MTDPVNQPAHYKAHPSGIEVIQITEHMNFCLGNAIKYILRADHKGKPIEDLQKARWYIEREIQRRQAALPDDAAPKEATKERAKPIRNSARALQRAKFKSGPSWTLEEDETAIEMTARGFTTAEVAEKLGRPYHGTRKRLLKHSAEIKARAEKYLAEREAPKPASDWTPDLDERLRKYMADELGIGGAAAMLMRPRDKVQARWDELEAVG